MTQSPLKTHGFQLRSKLSEDDLKRMTEFARDRFDNIMCCLQEMPRTLLLVIRYHDKSWHFVECFYKYFFRNLNTIRAIAHDHGNPIDRYNVLARSATKSAYSGKTSITKTLLDYPQRWYFELILRLAFVWHIFFCGFLIIIELVESRFWTHYCLLNINEISFITYNSVFGH